MDWKTDVQPIVTGLIRHAITAVATALGGVGALSGDQQTQFISVGTALVLYAISLGWSSWQKRHQKVKVEDAAATGVVK